MLYVALPDARGPISIGTVTPAFRRVLPTICLRVSSPRCTVQASRACHGESCGFVQIRLPSDFLVLSPIPPRPYPDMQLSSFLVLAACIATALASVLLDHAQYCTYSCRSYTVSGDLWSSALRTSVLRCAYDAPEPAAPEVVCVYSLVRPPSGFRTRRAQGGHLIGAYRPTADCSRMTRPTGAQRPRCARARASTAARSTTSRRGRPSWLPCGPPRTRTRSPASTRKAIAAFTPP